MSSGTQSANITFTQPYHTTPVVGVKIVFEHPSSTEFFAHDLDYLVANPTTTGFTIRLNQLAPFDLGFEWMAVGVAE